MSETLPTRREVAAETGELPPDLEAVRTLQNLGVLRPLAELNLYHGRNGDGSDWSVVEKNNAGNSTGNRNINNIPALNTGTYSTARQFAEARALRNSEHFDNPRPEVYHIISDDPDANIIEPHIDWSAMSPEDRKTASGAIAKTLPKLFEGAPLSFDERKALERIESRQLLTGVGGTRVVSSEMIPIYAERTGLDPELVERICGANNVIELLRADPSWIKRITDSFRDNTRGISAKFPDGSSRNVPLNREYTASWLKKMHTVGVCISVHSATIHQAIDNFLLFDHDKVNTETEIGERKEKIEHRLGHLATEFAKKGAESRKTPIVNSLNNLYAKPREVVEAAKGVPGFRKLFEGSTGVREGFTLEQHTETVLNVFEDNFADRLPAKTLPLMRMALLVHDIGKPVAVEDGAKDQQKVYNLTYAEHFMKTSGVNGKNRDLILKMIGEGMELTNRFAVRHDETASADLQSFCAETLRDYMDDRPSRSDVVGLRNMLMVLQTCDSAAYTDMAITRDTNSGIIYRNAPVFNHSFESAHGTTGRKARLKTPDVNSLLF